MFFDVEAGMKKSNKRGASEGNVPHQDPVKFK